MRKNEQKRYKQMHYKKKTSGKVEEKGEELHVWKML